MPDKKTQANGKITVWWVPAAGIADYRSPTPAEINAGKNLSAAIAWDGFELGASDSNDIDDRSLVDAGNAVTRGFEQFAATIPFFRSATPGDLTSDYTIAFELFKVPRVEGYLIWRVLQSPNDPANTASLAKAGEWISIGKFIGNYMADDTEGEDSVKFTVGFLPQGQVKIYTQVKNATAVAVTPTTLSVAVKKSAVATATLAGKSVTQGATWSAADPSVAAVSNNGVVTGLKVGTTTVTASHPAATGAATTIAVTVTA